MPRRARPPQTFFNDVITACGWGTKVAALERYLLDGHMQGPPEAIALILGRQRGHAASSQMSVKNTSEIRKTQDVGAVFSAQTRS